MSGFDLVAHIGMPKTATSSLQVYLSSRQGYIGRGSKHYQLTKDLLRIFYRYSRGRSVDHDLRQWIEGIKTWRELEGVVEPVLISEEFFFGGEFNLNPEFPLLARSWKSRGDAALSIARFLAKLQASRNLGIESVECILTIRSQPEWLGSKYAQDSAKIISPSQQDFEKRLRTFLLLKDLSWCDWSRWVRDLDSGVGKQHVHVLCMEEIEGGEFWRRIDALCGIESQEVEAGAGALAVCNPHLNKRRGQNGEWLLSDFKPGACLAKMLRWPAGSRRQKVMVRVGNATRRIGAKKLYRRGEKIFLSDALINQVSDICGPGNDWLSDRLGKSLSALHYPVPR